MADLFVLFLSLTIFGAGATIVDFIGVFNNNSDDSDAGDSDVSVIKTGSDLINNDKQSKNDKAGFKIISKIMSLLRSVIYFSLGFGPTGLFAFFTGMSKTSGLIWAFSVGTAIMILAHFLKRFVRKDLDSSIKTDELLQEKGVLLLPLEGNEISKAIVRQYGRELEIFVRSRDKNINLPKGKEVIIDEYDDDIYWIIPVE